MSPTHLEVTYTPPWNPTPEVTYTPCRNKAFDQNLLLFGWDFLHNFGCKWWKPNSESNCNTWLLTDLNTINTRWNRRFFPKCRQTFIELTEFRKSAIVISGSYGWMVISNWCCDKLDIQIWKNPFCWSGGFLRLQLLKYCFVT